MDSEKESVCIKQSCKSIRCKRWRSKAVQRGWEREREGERERERERELLSREHIFMCVMCVYTNRLFSLCFLLLILTLSLGLMD